MVRFVANCVLACVLNMLKFTIARGYSDRALLSPISSLNPINPLNPISPINPLSSISPIGPINPTGTNPIKLEEPSSAIEARAPHQSKGSRFVQDLMQKPRAPHQAQGL